jgi:hypothetical protein
MSLTVIIPPHSGLGGTDYFLIDQLGDSLVTSARGHIFDKVLPWHVGQEFVYVFEFFVILDT